jgi:hypothetical protein
MDALSGDADAKDKGMHEKICEKSARESRKPGGR